MILPETVTTPRLVLRKPRMEDAYQILSQYAQDALVTKYLLWRPHTSIEDTNVFLARCLEHWSGDNDFAWVIESKEKSELMGMIGLRLEQMSAHLGYVLARKFWNKGYMSEAAKVLVDWSLTQRGIFRTWAVCDPENIASARVLEKAGMQREGILRRWAVLPNISSQPRDCYCYSKVK